VRNNLAIPLFWRGNRKTRGKDGRKWSNVVILDKRGGGTMERSELHLKEKKNAE